MKKLTCLGLSVIMALSLLAGCGGSGNNTDSNTNNTGDNTSASQAASTPENTKLSGTISTNGSTSM